MSNSRLHIQLLTAVLLPLLLTGCLEQARTHEIHQRLDELKARPSGRVVESLPEFPEPVLATYTQSGARDPFQPVHPILEEITSLADDSGLAPDTRRTRSVLEQYELETLSIRGIMQRRDRARALVVTPDNQVVSVEIGDYMGRNHGRVTRISENSIHLTELIADNRGRWQEREQHLSISR